MCLSQLDEQLHPVKYAWKLFYLPHNKRSRFLISPTMRERQKKHGWNVVPRRKQIAMKSYDGGGYTAGFHAYTREREAIEARWGDKAIRRVEVRDVIASGVQNGYRVVVVKAFRIVPKKRRATK
jgi:hypothetical protein